MVSDVGQYGTNMDVEGGEEGTRTNAVVVHGNTAYFRPTKVYSYQNIAGEKQWSQLPDNPNVNCGLEIIDGLLTSVGGDNNGPTNVLLSLTGEGERKQWLEIFPPMPTPRYGAACVNTEDGLVVAGGYADGDQSINSVEALCTDRSTKWWRTVYSLPKRQSYLSGVVCGNILYLAGGLEDGKPSQTPFTCNLSDINVLPTRHISHASGDKHGWFEFSQLPVTQATLASFNDRLLAIDGNDDSGNPTMYMMGTLTHGRLL